MRIVLAFAAILLSLLPAQLYAHGGTEVVVRGDVRADTLMNIEGEEFDPDDVVRIELRKQGAEPFQLGEVKADGEGSFTVSFRLPANIAAGLYTLAAEGRESATTDVTVLAPLGGDEPSLAEPTASVGSDRPVEETIGLWLLVAGLAAAGGALLWFSGRKPHAASAGGPPGR